MKLKLRLRLNSAGGEKSHDSGVFRVDSRTLPAALDNLDPAAGTADLSSAVHTHLSGLPPEWVRDFLRSV